MNMLVINPGSIIRFLKKHLHKQRLRRLIFDFLTKGLVLSIVTTEQLTDNSKKYPTLLFGSQELILADPLLYIEEPPEAIKPSLCKLTLHQPFVAEILNAQLAGPTAAAFDEDGKLILESLPGIDILPLRTLIFQKLFLAKTPQLDIACSLVNAHNKVYGHWITDCLMRLEGFEYYQEKTGCKPLLILDSNLTSWQIDSLKLLGYEPDNYIPWNWAKVNVKKLVLPSFRRQGTWIEANACQWLRNRMLSNLPSAQNTQISFSPRIYISRNPKAGRSVINEDEVIEALIPFGFVSYTLENINFIDEVRLFSQAEIIIGTHGSGLVNMIFSQNKPIIIDLFSSWYTSWFFNLSAALGFQYRCLKCQPSEQDLSLTRGNMIVDVAKLKQLISITLLDSI
jgi:hypothetical protein